MNVYGYVRVSTTEQAQNGESLDIQKNQISGWAMMKGWQVTEVFVEECVSGSVPLCERPDGQRLLAVLQKGDVILTPKLDRMFRRASGALATLQELKSQEVALHMLDLGGDVTGKGISKLVFTILSAVAGNERERITDVKRHMARQSIYSGGKVPFGFDVQGDRLVENPAQQAVIARMRELRAGGASYREIVRAAGFSDPKTVQRILGRAA
jgi:DNA invertase Pin-like site-specific DNA recombinase